MENQVTGVISRILPIEKGTTKGGTEWQKQVFVVKNNDGYEGKETSYPFTLFGKSVDTFEKFNKVGDKVTVKFRIDSNEWNDKFFTSLNAYRIDKVESSSVSKSASVESDFDDDLPY